MKAWYEQKEQSAGTWRLNALLFFYRVFGLKSLKCLLIVVVFFIWLFAKPARTASRQYKKVLNNYQKRHQLTTAHFSSYRHILNYAWSLADKLAAFMGKSLPFTVNDNDAWRAMIQDIQNKRGCFFIFSHIGNVEALPALLKAYPNLPKTQIHAFMQVNQNSIFHNFVMDNAALSNVSILPMDNMGVSMGFEIASYLEAGDIVMMAGDRVAAQNTKAVVYEELLDCSVAFPKGVFKLAKASGAAVYFISATRARKRYVVDVAQAPEHEMAKAFAAFMQAQALAHPIEWFNFYDFFTE